MLHYSQLQGVIFDIDDTLLDNKPRDPLKRMHERARLAAMHEVGKRHGIRELIDLSPEDNLEGFLTAPVHTLESAIWNIMFKAGLAAVNEPEPDNPIFQEVIRRKDELYEVILREEGEEVPGASVFVHALAAHGLAGKMAIASTAIPRDIGIFLEKVGLAQLFPDERIISKYKVTRAKPDPEAFDLAFAALGLPESARSKVVVFEDDPRGIMAAKAAGLPVFAITVGHDREDLAHITVPPDVIADSFAEFARLLGLPLH